MRRSLHSLLVGLLVCSLSIDAVRACGHLRHWHDCPPPGAVTVVIVAADDRDWCCPVDPGCPVDCGCSDIAFATPAGDDSACCEEIACRATPEALAATSVVVAAPVVTSETDGIGGVIVSETAPTLAPAPQPAAPAPASIAPEPVAAAPGLEPVEPVSASEPAVEQPAPPSEQPAPRNAFEEADAALAPDLDGPAPAGEPASAPQPPADPAVEPRAAREPLRRWIDDTGAYAVVGRLVDVRGAHVVILRADGRSVTVPLARLSSLDRGYVAGAAARITAAQPGSPQPTDTADR